jgi:cytoskeletal protein RodZ
VNNKPHRTKKHGNTKRKAVHLVLWVNPIVKAALMRSAEYPRPACFTDKLIEQPTTAETETLDASHRQDKARIKSARATTTQPAAMTPGLRAPQVQTQSPRSPEPLNPDETAGQAVSSRNCTKGQIPHPCSNLTDIPTNQGWQRRPHGLATRSRPYGETGNTTTKAINTS